MIYSRSVKSPKEIINPTGRLGVLLVGLGAVSTTFIAGVYALRKNLADPTGSLTQMGTIRLGKRTEGRSPLIRDFVPLASLDDLVFGGWDIFEEIDFQGTHKRFREGEYKSTSNLGSALTKEASSVKVIAC